MVQCLMVLCSEFFGILSIDVKSRNKNFIVLMWEIKNCMLKETRKITRDEFVAAELNKIVLFIVL